MKQIILISINFVTLGLLVFTNIRLNSLEKKLIALSEIEAENYEPDSTRFNIKKMTFNIPKGSRYIIKDSLWTDTIVVSYDQKFKFGDSLFFNSLRYKNIKYIGYSNLGYKQRLSYVIRKKINLVGNIIIDCRMDVYDRDGKKGIFFPGIPKY